MEKQKFRKYKRIKNSLGRPEEIQAVLDRCLQGLGKPEHALLTKLWQHWDMVMGDEISALAWPLGYKDGVLHVGGEDAISVQELSFMSTEMLERANAFMEKNFFTAVRVRLSLDKTPLHEVVKRAGPKHEPLVLREAGLSGKYLEDMDNSSPVARCYARFVQVSKQGK